MGYSYGSVVTGCAISNYPMDCIPILEKNLTEIGAILATNA